MKGTSSRISRREFLSCAGAGVSACLLPPRWFTAPRLKVEDWPRYTLADLPARQAKILALAPDLVVLDNGRLVRQNARGDQGDVPLARTQWNKDAHYPADRLKTDVPWGIVLHWYGDREDFTRTVWGYLNGFDSLRPIDDYFTRTSAHFLVGWDRLQVGEPQDKDPVSILQTQIPDEDGTPFAASHLKNLDYYTHKARLQYFVRALYKLGFADPGVFSVLQEMFDGRVIDPNMRTIGIEMCGYDFETAHHEPPDQQVANVLAVVWALMQRYRIPVMNLLGHHEIDLGKADPGKKFMALMRMLVGAKALVSDDPLMKSLVFGSFLNPAGDTGEAIQRYFQFVRSYLVMTATPSRVYEWETRGHYWFLHDFITGSAWSSLAASYLPPVDGYSPEYGNIFLVPENHEGIDLYPNGGSAPVYLTTSGRCLYASEGMGCRLGKMAIFKHRLPNGGEILTVYGNLSQLGSLKPGELYRPGIPVGMLQSARPHQQPFLHYAVAYGATWETDLALHPEIPLNAGATWIRQRYLHPLPFLLDRLHDPGLPFSID